MSLGPDVPEWEALRARLAALAAESRAHNAYVLDAWGTLWCAAHSVGYGV